MLQLPLYVEIAAKKKLPPGWKPTGLADRCKIKVQTGEKWWELPKVHAECVFRELIYQESTLAYYAWCWGNTRNGSWRPWPDMRTNINRYMIDVEHLEQINIDTARKRKIKLEDAEDGLLSNVDVVNALARCRLSTQHDHQHIMANSMTLHG